MSTLNLPHLSNCHRAKMDASVSMEAEVIKNLKGKTAPGLDGFLTPYYKTFAETLHHILPDSSIT